MISIGNFISQSYYRRFYDDFKYFQPTRIAQNIIFGPAKVGMIICRVGPDPKLGSGFRGKSGKIEL